MKGSKKDRSSTLSRTRARELLDFAHHIPGIAYASQTECTPLSGGLQSGTFSRSDRPLPEAYHVGDSIRICGTGPEYARAAGVCVDVLIDDRLDLPAKLPAKPKHS